MKLSDLIKELFESPEMAEYLITHSEELPKYRILDMICKAPIDIRRKAEILAELAENEDIEKEVSEEMKNMPPDKADIDSIRKDLIQNSYHFHYEYVSKAIALLSSNPGDIFTTQTIWYDDDYPDEHDKGDFHVSSSFENALRYIEEEMRLDDLQWKNKEILFYYEIRKWVLNEQGDYEEIICYEYIDGEVMHFTYADRREYLRNKFTPDGNLNLITPFSTGDILAVDCTPYKPKRNILILENEMNDDCCSLQGLALDPHKKVFFIGAVKHCSMYRGLYRPDISPLYRITKPDEPLTDEESVFTEIQAFLESDPKKGQEMWLWIHNATVQKNKEGVTADEIRKYIKNHAG